MAATHTQIPEFHMSLDRSSTLSLHHRHLRIHPLTWAIAVALAPVAAGALPQDGIVKQGQATIQTPQTGLMEIRQGSQTAAVDWRSFSVGKGETVTSSSRTPRRC